MGGASPLPTPWMASWPTCDSGAALSQRHATPSLSQHAACMGWQHLLLHFKLAIITFMQ